MKLIPLKGKYGQGQFTKVSDEDFAFARSLSLYMNDGYVKSYYKRKHWKLHQLLVGSHYDHINGDKLDNQRGNLRKATQAQNNANVAPRAKSGFKGVYETPDGFTVKVYKNGRTIHIGIFEDKHHAAVVADLWNRDLHGEFAQTNFTIVSNSPRG
jgi:hypothetical protein